MTTDKDQEHLSQSEKCRFELRRRIIAGHWPALTKMREVTLATELGVSRTPVRTALVKLEQEGLLMRVGGGYTVRAFSYQDAIIAIELRGVIEGTAVRLAAERSDVHRYMSKIKETVAELDQVIAAGAVDGYSDLNDQFHSQLAALAGNDMIQLEVQRASRLPFAAPSAFSSSKSDLRRFKNSLIVGQQHHHALIESIERGESARAEALAREHAHLAKKNIEVAYHDQKNTQLHTPQLALITQ